MTATQTVRVRFSFTHRNPHVGLVRTAVQLGLRPAHRWQPVFRIETTDAQRDSEESYLALRIVLRWLGHSGLG